VAARLIVLGRQGSGKGTQCSRLAQGLGIRHVSTGDLFRREITAGSAIGRQIERYVSNGELVPDPVVLDVVAANLGSTEARQVGYLLDGFPRTLSQGQALFEVLGADAADLAVEIDVPAEVVALRLSRRRVCGDCDASTDDAGLDARCADCGGQLLRRADDHPEAIARRLSLYDGQSASLRRWLESQGLLVSIDGVGTPDLVHDRLVTAIAQRVPQIRALIR
jgi:adenylate kinase